MPDYYEDFFGITKKVLDTALSPEEKTRHVRDSDFWDAPVGTPLPLPDKPAGKPKAKPKSPKPKAKPAETEEELLKRAAKEGGENWSVQDGVLVRWNLPEGGTATVSRLDDGNWEGRWQDEDGADLGFTTGSVESLEEVMRDIDDDAAANAPDPLPPPRAPRKPKKRKPKKPKGPKKPTGKPLKKLREMIPKEGIILLTNGETYDTPWAEEDDPKLTKKERAELNDAALEVTFGIQSRVSDAVTSTPGMEDCTVEVERYAVVLDIYTQEVEVSLRIKDGDGGEIGYVSRNVQEKTVYNNHFELDAEYQGKGVASKMISALEDLYREWDVEKVEVFANLDIGGYTWAKMGFQFTDEDSRAEVAKLFKFKAEYKARLKRRGFSAEEIDAAKDQAKELIARGDAEPIDFAMIGWTPGAKKWVGKEVMLGSQWSGVKKL